MNIYLFELRQYRKTIVFWSLSFAFITAVYMVFAPVFIEEAAVVREMFEGMGAMVLRAMGIHLDLFFSATGFYSFLMTFLLLMAAIQAAYFGLSVISKETVMKTHDFLLTKPASRTRFFVCKVDAMVCGLLITEAVFYLSAYVCIKLFSGSFAAKEFWLISFSLTFVQMMFLGYGLLVGTIAKKIKSPNSVAFGVAMFFFAISMLANITGISELNYITPFAYFNANTILMSGHYETKFVLLTAAVIAVTFAASLFIYKKHDVKAG